LNRIRILSLDGGGSHAGVHARTLGALFGPDTPGRDIIRQFDFVAGNSGGSVVFTALCCNYTPSDIAAFYNDPATLRRMFSPKWTAGIPLLRDVLPRYSSKGKFEALKWIFDRHRQDGEPLPSTIRLQDWPKYLKSEVNLIVTAFDYDRERAAFFRSNLTSRAKSSAPAVDATLVEAVHASTNAPIRYFDKPAEVSGRRYWDGGLGGYDNPVLAAVVEALANRPAEADDIRVLSIGTGAIAQPLTTERAAPSIGKVPDSTCLFSALKKVATVIFDDPPDAASFHAHVALRQPMPLAGATLSEGSIVRLCPLLSPVWDPNGGGWKLPGAVSGSDFQALIAMELDAMTEPELALIRTMCDLWIAGEIRNQPIRMGEHLRCDIGHEKFSEAAAHWRRIAY
jgi:predicted acylesterase/phospholipase RssA